MASLPLYLASKKIRVNKEVVHHLLTISAKTAHRIYAHIFLAGKSHTGMPNCKEIRGYSLSWLSRRKGNAFLINRYYFLPHIAYNNLPGPALLP